MTAPVLEARELYRFYHAGGEETLALRGVSLTVDAGEIVAVVGPSGSGKSTLLACLAGLDEPNGGSVLFQSANLLETLTVGGNVTLAMRLTGTPEAGRRAALLADLGLSARIGAYPAELSGGEAARAGLAVALANDPVLILADEPTGEVDGPAEATVLSLLRTRTQAGAAVVIVTHSPAVAAAADRTVALLDGGVVDDDVADRPGAA